MAWLDLYCSFDIFFRICGHRDPEIPLDTKPFGFPFDRDIDFDIHGKEKTLGWASDSHLVTNVAIQLSGSRYGSDHIFGGTFWKTYSCWECNHNYNYGNNCGLK